MTSSTATSNYARLSPWQARAVLIALVLLIGFGLWKSPTPPPLCNVREENAKSGDVFLYMSEIKRIHAGENYYQAAAEELVAQGYPTASVFNWRTPLPMWLIGKLPDPLAGRLILIADGHRDAADGLRSGRAGTTQRLSTGHAADRAPDCAAAALFSGQCLRAHRGLGGDHDGAVIAVAYGVDLRFLGATMALAALFFRELALPYCLLGLALALWQRRPKESMVYVVGLAGWAVFYGLHCWKVSPLITATAEAHRQGWVRFGGLTFVIAVAQMNSCLVLLPVWVTVVFFALAMFGFAGCRTDWSARGSR